jgi:hypothetical protein
MNGAIGGMDSRYVTVISMRTIADKVATMPSVE